MSAKASGFFWYWILATIAVAALSCIWFMSPVAMGFMTPSSSKALAEFTQNFYNFTYFVGIPGLIIVHIIAGAFGITGKRKVGYKLSIISIFLFLISILLVSVLFDRFEPPAS